VGVTSFGDELTGDFCDGFEAISIGDFGLFYRLAGKIVSRILGLLQQYRPFASLKVTQRYVWELKSKRTRKRSMHSVENDPTRPLMPRRSSPLLTLARFRPI